MSGALANVVAAWGFFYAAAWLGVPRELGTWVVTFGIFFGCLAGPVLLNLARFDVEWVRTVACVLAMAHLMATERSA